MTVYNLRQAQALMRRELDVQASMADQYGLTKVLNTPLLLGPPGIGKTTICFEEASLRGLEYNAINVGELSDPADFGIPVPQKGEDGNFNRLEYCFSEPILKACQEPTLLFCDDIDKAPQHVRGAFLSVTGSRTFRGRPLHKGTLIVAAGNRPGDDMDATELSESLKTRMTILEVEPDLASFTAYGANGVINSNVLGYLTYRPEHLSQRGKAGVNRFPCPRAWWEASRHMEMFPDPVEDVLKNGQHDGWKIIVSNKCGDPVGHEFWAWFCIIKQVNVSEILATGQLPVLTSPDGKRADPRMAQYAAIFALSQHLTRHGINPANKGLTVFIQNLDAEMQVALAMQIPSTVLGTLAQQIPSAAAALMTPITGGL